MKAWFHPGLRLAAAGAVAIAAAGLCFGGAAQKDDAAQPARGVPAWILSPPVDGGIVDQWNFANPNAWQALNAGATAVAVSNGVLRVDCTASDPYIGVGVPARSGRLLARFRMRSCNIGPGEFFWSTEREAGFDPSRACTFRLQHDARWHDYEVTLGDGASAITAVRLDPGMGTGWVEIASFELRGAEPHPLTVQRLEATSDSVTVYLTNSAPAAVTGMVSRVPFVAPASGATRVTVSAPGTASVETVAFKVEAAGLPDIGASLYVIRPDAGRAAVTRRAGSLELWVLADGRSLVLKRDGRDVARVAPIVAIDGQPVPLVPRKGWGRTVRLTGDGVGVELTLNAGGLAVAIRSERPCEGPVVRVPGTMERAVFPGLEYLERGECSSSTLDIRTAESLRYAPDPLKVTIPLMAAETDQGLVALRWKDAALQPVFASPDFLDGTADHRMALRGTNIEAALLTGTQSLERCLLDYLRDRGLPPLPPAPRDEAGQRALCLSALQTALKGSNGWGHCAEPGWGRAWFADQASWVWRLTGEVPAMPGVVEGGSHVRNDAIYFVSGRAAEWLAVRRSRVQQVLASQRADGSFAYSGPFREGHFEDTASGHSAAQAIELLDYAWITGDVPARDAGLKALEALKRFKVPRGAQTWELALHTPDILAAAYEVHAFVRGYELTGRREYLALASERALRGVPFIYLRGSLPVMAYATVPVFGATGWTGMNWMGLPVQWCGLVYAHSLAMLAGHDPQPEWTTLSRGILRTAQQMQYPEGPRAGCFPDFYWLTAQHRDGPSINPCSLLAVEALLDGRVDSLAVATGGAYRVAAPFPVSVDGRHAVVEGRAGLAYAVLVNGVVRTVQSKGCDVIDLEP